jgi:hypothetical protein
MANALVESAKISATGGGTDLSDAIKLSTERNEHHMQAIVESTAKTSEKIDTLTDIFTMYLQSKLDKVNAANIANGNI